MKKFLVVSLVLNVVLLTFCGLYIYHNRENLVQKVINRKQRAKIVMFGDSHTANGNWSFLLKKFGVKRSGHGGFTSDQLKSLIHEDVIRFKPEICFIQMGGNDIRSKHFSCDSVVNNFASVVRQFKHNHIEPVVQSLFFRPEQSRYNQLVDSLNQRLVSLCKSNNVQFLDINAALTAKGINKANYLGDGIHLSATGYHIWAREVRNFLSEIK